MSEPLEKEYLSSEQGDLRYVVVGQSADGRYQLQDPDTGDVFTFAIVDNEDIETELRALDRLGYRWEFATGAEEAA